jgi:hypothetical protein
LGGRTARNAEPADPAIRTTPISDSAAGIEGS